MDKNTLEKANNIVKTIEYLNILNNDMHKIENHYQFKGIGLIAEFNKGCDISYKYNFTEVDKNSENLIKSFCSELAYDIRLMIQEKCEHFIDKYEKELKQL